MLPEPFLIFALQGENLEFPMLDPNKILLQSSFVSCLIICEAIHTAFSSLLYGDIYIPLYTFTFLRKANSVQRQLLLQRLLKAQILFSLTLDKADSK